MKGTTSVAALSQVVDCGICPQRPVINPDQSTDRRPFLKYGVERSIPGFMDLVGFLAPLHPWRHTDFSGELRISAGLVGSAPLRDLTVKAPGANGTHR